MDPPAISETELLNNNAKVLRQRKLYFKTSLKKNIGLLGYVSIIYVYLLESSIITLFFRICFQSVISSPIPLESSETLNRRMKFQVARMLMVMPLSYNFLMILINFLFFNIDNNDPSVRNGFKYGGFFIQIIGEKVCHNRFKLLINELLIVFFQLLLLSIWCFENLFDEEDLQDLAIDNEQDGSPEGDGYSNQINIMSISLTKIIKKVLFTKDSQLRFEDDDDEGQIELNLESRLNALNSTLNLNNV